MRRKLGRDDARVLRNDDIYVSWRKCTRMLFSNPGKGFRKKGDKLSPFPCRNLVIPIRPKVARFFWVQEPVIPPAWHSQWTLGLSYSRTLYMTSASRARLSITSIRDFRTRPKMVRNMLLVTHVRYTWRPNKHLALLASARIWDQSSA
jgi:hypothetical protein